MQKVREDPNITLTKGKVARISEDPATGDLLVEFEDIFAGRKSKANFDLVVLAAGIVQSTKD